MKVLRVMVAITVILASTGLAARADETGWTLRMYGVMVDSSAEASTGVGGVVSRVDVGGGFGIGGEYRLSDRFGFDLSTVFAGLDIQTSASGAGSTQSLDLGMVPLTFGVTIHLLPAGRVDLFLAPTLSYVSYFELHTSFRWDGSSATAEDSSDAAIGAALGLDLPFGEGKWTVCAGLRYMKTDAEGTDVDPLMATLGFGRRF